MNLTTFIRRSCALSSLIILGSLSPLWADSIFKSGHWVKVGVRESGLYEIPYSRLLEMGFSNPEEVSVFGKGGKPYDNNFTDSKGTPLYSSGLDQIAVWHENGKLYFYASGVEDISFNAGGNKYLPGYFSRNNLNIYSSTGLYFLSDSHSSPQHISTSDINATEPAEPVGSGVGYQYHEKDLYQNNTNTGQVFWGETFTASSTLNFPLSTPFISSSRKARMDCSFYASSDCRGSLEFGVEGAMGNFSRTFKSTGGQYVSPQIDTYTFLIVPQNSENVFVSVTGNVGKYCALDYWVISYEKDMPDGRVASLSVDNQETISYSVENGKRYILPLDVTSPSLRIFDITDREKPVNIPWNSTSSQGGEGFVKAYGDHMDLLVADLSLPQKSVDYYQSGSVVENQDIQSSIDTSAELLIITLPSLRPTAERIAALHEKYDGIKTAVVESDDVYNEYSGGLPDPMAYRAVARDLYNRGGGRLKNLLLIGQITADMRGIITPHSSDSYLIAYQSPVLYEESKSKNMNDFYGIFEPYISPDKFEMANIDIGVGMLPFFDNEEAEDYLLKLERFLDSDDHAWYLNEMMGMSDAGDTHTHDVQMINVSRTIKKISAGTVYSPIVVDAYGVEGARSKFVDVLNSGEIASLYIGHGSPDRLGRSRIFTPAHINLLENTRCGMMMFAGCELSTPDLGVRGIGETMVIGTSKGLLGSLLASRATWSSQNYDLANSLFTCFFRESTAADARYHSSTPTIGEVVAMAKNNSVYSNKMAYMYLGDPAVRFPVGLLGISVTSPSSIVVEGGKVLNINGTVVEQSGIMSSGFEGKIVVKLMEPLVVMTSQDLVSNTAQDEGKSVDVEYGNVLVSSVEGEVVDGRFSVSLPVPSSFSKFAGRQAILHLAAYSRERHIGATGKQLLDVVSNSSGSQGVLDREAPTVSSLDYDKNLGKLKFNVSDNAGVRPQSRNVIKISIEGREFNGNDLEVESVSGESNSYDCSLRVDMVKGLHHADFTVHDIAGNVMNETLSFYVEELSYDTSLLLDSLPVEDNVGFSVIGRLSADAVLVIEDIDGNLIRTIPAKERSITWDRLDNGKKRVASGLYRAYLKSKENALTQSSNAVDIPLY